MKQSSGWLTWIPVLVVVSLMPVVTSARIAPQRIRQTRQTADVSPPAPLATPVAAAPGVRFTTNGCSGFREGKFASCCVVHDFAFWAGGTRADRRVADRNLRRCLVRVTRGNLYDRGVARAGFWWIRSTALFATWVTAGWGRAWPEPRPTFHSLTPDQRAFVAAERRRVCDSMTLDTATGTYRLDDGRPILPYARQQLCG
jgi:hypothetical protein